MIQLIMQIFADDFIDIYLFRCLFSKIEELGKKNIICKSTTPILPRHARY
jgi:hypothetical protein